MGAGQAKEEWACFRIGSPIPPNALIAASIKGEKVYIGRAYNRNRGVLMVGYYETQKKAYMCVDGRVEELRTPVFEMLTGCGHIWVSTAQFLVPNGAVGVGVNTDGHTLYVGRTRCIDKRDKTQCNQIVSVNPTLKICAKLDKNVLTNTLDNTLQLLIEAPATLKLTESDLQSSRTASRPLVDDKILSISKHIVNHAKTGLALIVHAAKYNVSELSLSGLKIAADEAEKKCCICMVTDKNALFLPCRHVCCCHECGVSEKSRTAQCPLCRKIIQDVIQIFF